MNMEDIISSKKVDTEIIRKNIEAVMTIESNERLANDVYRMKLIGDTRCITKPGQFVNIKLDGFYLRRPISVCDWEPGENGSLTLIYKVVGNGTEYMSGLNAGDGLNMLMGLGNGFDVSLSGNHPLLVGGGAGTPPMYGLARRLVEQGKSVDVILGFNSAEDAFYMQEFDELNEFYEFGCEGFSGERPRVKVHIATVDGSLGKKGFVTDCLQDICNAAKVCNDEKTGNDTAACNAAKACNDAMTCNDTAARNAAKADELTSYYACGPIPMLKALALKTAEHLPQIKGQLSFEERMGCGFGACVGCSCKTKYGNKRICKDGPVLSSEEVIW